VKLFGTGSTFLRTYLPEGDIDLVAMPVGSRSSSDGELSLFSSLFSGFLKLTDKPAAGGADTAVIVKNIEFVNARARVLHCTCDSGLEVDITINRGGALNTIAFLEEADELIGRDHLFKRSVLLIKAWCSHEAVNYCGKSILGSKTV
jgi:DNA polymerase sigma